jgi:hypothetical protein
MRWKDKIIIGLKEIGCADVELIYLEEFCLLKYNSVRPVESQPRFRRNVSPPSSASRNKPNKKPA